MVRIINNQDTLRSKFVEKIECPIWYYKELKETTVDYVIWNLLKENFVVEIDGARHEITFGKNQDDDIIQYIRYDDFSNKALTSFEVVEKGFTIGKWFTVTEIDTSDKFKAEYREKLEKYGEEELERSIRKVFIDQINDDDDLTEDEKKILLSQIEASSIEELQQIFEEAAKINRKQN